MQQVRFVCQLLILTLCTSTLHAQSAIDALRAADARFQALGSYTANMGFTMGDHRDVGKVYYQGKQYHLDFPEDQTICDGAKTMNWNKEFAIVDFYAPSTGPDLSAGGIYRLHQFKYRCEWVDTMGYMQRMRLTAEDESLNPPTVLIGIGRKSGFVEEYTIFLKSGITIEMQILDFQLNPELDPKLFIIDMDFVRRVENGEVPPIEHEH